MNYVYLSNKESFWKDLLQKSHIDHIYNAWLSEYDSYNHYIHEQYGFDFEDIILEKKSFLRHLITSIFFYFNDKDCATFIKNMIKDQKRQIFTGHFLLYLLEENTIFRPSILSAIDNESTKEPNDYLLLHSLMFPNDVSSEGNAIAMSPDISGNATEKLSAIDGLKLNNHIEKLFLPKSESLFALIELFRQNIVTNPMWSKIITSRLINDINIITSEGLFSNFVEKGIFLDDICQDTSNNLKKICIDFSSHHCTGQHYSIICKMLDQECNNTFSDSILLIYKEVLLSVEHGLNPNASEILKLCQNAMSITEPNKMINNLSKNETMLLACKYHDVSPIEALNMSENFKSANAALQNIIK